MRLSLACRWRTQSSVPLCRPLVLLLSLSFPALISSLFVFFAESGVSCKPTPDVRAVCPPCASHIQLLFAGAYCRALTAVLLARRQRVSPPPSPSLPLSRPRRTSIECVCALYYACYAKAALGFRHCRRAPLTVIEVRILRLQCNTAVSHAGRP